MSTPDVKSAKEKHRRFPCGASLPSWIPAYAGLMLDDDVSDALEALEDDFVATELLELEDDFVATELLELEDDLVSTELLELILDPRLDSELLTLLEDEELIPIPWISFRISTIAALTSRLRAESISVSVRTLARIVPPAGVLAVVPTVM